MVNRLKAFTRVHLVKPPVGFKVRTVFRYDGSLAVLMLPARQVGVTSLAVMLVILLARYQHFHSARGCLLRLWPQRKLQSATATMGLYRI